MEMVVAPPESPVPERLFCPPQEKIDDISIYTWNTSKGLQGWWDLQEAMKRRQTSLSPFTILAQGRTIPVTPLANPKPKSSSYFIIQMIDEDDKEVKVNCLLSDTDLYFKGFERELTEQGLEEKRKKERDGEASSSKGRKKKTNELSLKGIFYRFEEDDMDVPKFLKATKLNIQAGYRKRPKPGGKHAIRHMFRAFSRYQDGTITDEELEVACYCFMATVCEPSRLFSCYLEVGRRIGAQEFPSEVNDLMWNNIDNWGQFGGVVLKARLQGLLGSYRLLPAWCKDRHQLAIMGDLIGQRGELLLVRINPTLIGISEERLKEIIEDAASGNTGPAYRSDPGFELVG